MIRNQTALEEAKISSIDYLRGITIKPFARKCLLDPKNINITEDDLEFLAKMQIDSSDLLKEVQE